MTGHPVVHFSHHAKLTIAIGLLGLLSNFSFEAKRARTTHCQPTGWYKMKNHLTRELKVIRETFGSRQEQRQRVAIHARLMHF